MVDRAWCENWPRLFLNKQNKKPQFSPSVRTDAVFLQSKKKKKFFAFLALNHNNYYSNKKKRLVAIKWSLQKKKKIHTHFGLTDMTFCWSQLNFNDTYIKYKYSRINKKKTRRKRDAWLLLNWANVLKTVVCEQTKKQKKSECRLGKNVCAKKNTL